MKALVMVLLVHLVLTTSGHAFDPLHPGFPVCEGKEEGHWQTLTLKNKEGKEVSRLALTSIDYLDPSTVICWMAPDSTIIAGERRPSTPIKRQSSRKDRTIGALHELYAETR
jgi:hypothetical protein